MSYDRRVVQTLLSTEETRRALMVELFERSSPADMAWLVYSLITGPEHGAKPLEGLTDSQLEEIGRALRLLRERRQSVGLWHRVRVTSAFRTDSNRTGKVASRITCHVRYTPLTDAGFELQEGGAHGRGPSGWACLVADHKGTLPIGMRVAMEFVMAARNEPFLPEGFKELMDTAFPKADESQGILLPPSRESSLVGCQLWTAEFPVARSRSGFMRRWLPLSHGKPGI